MKYCTIYCRVSSNKQSNYQPPKQKGDPSHKGNDNLDQFPF